MLINRKFKILLFMFLCSIAVETQATIYFNDGQCHIIDYDETDRSIAVDMDMENNPPTRLEIIEGGKAKGVYAGHTGEIILNGGTVTYYLSAKDNSVVTILDGYLNYRYYAYDNSHFEMSGGTVTGNSNQEAMWLRDYSTATVSGGNLQGNIMLWEESTITFIGSDFAINGVSVDLYENIKNYATYEDISDGIYGYTGVITGTLADGSSLNNYFEIWYNNGVSDSTIYLIPEPCTILLLGLGVVGVLRRRR